MFNQLYATCLFRSSAARLGRAHPIAGCQRSTSLAAYWAKIASIALHLQDVTRLVRLGTGGDRSEGRQPQKCLLELTLWEKQEDTLLLCHIFKDLRKVRCEIQPLHEVVRSCRHAIYKATFEQVRNILHVRDHGRACVITFSYIQVLIQRLISPDTGDGLREDLREPSCCSRIS